VRELHSTLTCPVKLFDSTAINSLIVLSGTAEKFRFDKNVFSINVRLVSFDSPRSG